MAHKSAQTTWIWGLHSVESCVRHRPELIEEVFVYDSDSRDQDACRRETVLSFIQEQGLSVQRAAHENRAVQERRHQGMWARLKAWDFESWRDSEPQLERLLEARSPARPQFVLLEGLEDPRNFGALLRSAAAFSVGAVLVPRKGTSPLNGVVAQASAGCAFLLPIVEYAQAKDVMTWFRERGARVCALGAGGVPLVQAMGQPGPVLWYLGAEGRGLDEKKLSWVDQVCTIPMNSEVESLNVSVAGSLAFYQATDLSNAH